MSHGAEAKGASDVASSLAVAGLMPPSDEATLPSLVSGASKCFLNPVRFFVSWHGVLTLVYSGFPPAMVHLKQRMRGAFPSLPPENPGSKWPKTSLACVKDGERLAPDQLAVLNSICLAFSQELKVSSSTFVVVDVLSVTVFTCRSLEKKLANFQIELASTEGEGGGVDEAAPCEEEVARVVQVVAASAQPKYWVSASMDGNGEKHYRGEHLGVTLVHPLQCTEPKPSARIASAEGLPPILRRFQAAVDEAVPGMYAWFARESLHVTIQGLIG